MSGYDLLLLFQLTVQLVPAHRMAGGHALLNPNPMLLFTDVQVYFVVTAVQKPASPFLIFYWTDGFVM